MMSKIIGIFIVSLFFISSLFGQCIDGGGVFVNEVYNESGGSTEYVELVVVGDPANPTDPVDLTGWIVDDNNIAMADEGTAPGHLILDGSFSSVAPGTIILILNEHFPYAPLPGADPWLITVEGSDLDGCLDVPNFSDASYSPCGSGGSDYNTIIFNNSHDIIQTRQPDETYYHAVVYNAAVEGDISPYADISDVSSSLNCGDWFDGANYDALPETPGEPNSTENENLINAIRNGTLDCGNIDASCVAPCPEIDAIEIIPSTVCDNDPFTLRATGLSNMGIGANGTQDFGIEFVYFLGSSAPADPYSGGTNIASVDYVDLTGVDPDQVAETNISGETLTEGTYTICAILLDRPAGYDCDPYKCDVIEILESPTASLEGPIDFCPGDCNEVNTLITGGAPDYNVEFTFSAGVVNVTFPITSYQVDNQLIICYSESALFPEYVSADNTFYVPTYVTGTGSLTLNSIEDQNLCKDYDIDPNNITLTFMEKLDINDNVVYPPQCDDDFDGKVEFDLTLVEGDIVVDGGTVNWFSDEDCTNSISSPYLTGSTTVYVFLTDGDKCNSDTTSIDLVVIEYPNPGEDNQIDVCNTETDLNFNDQLGPDHSSDGVWEDLDDSGVDISDPDHVSFEGIDPKTYRYSFTTEDENGLCSKTVILTVSISETGYAGKDNDDSFCGSPEDYIDLNDYLSIDADNNGTWYDENGYEENDPSNLDLTNEPAGVYIYTYEIHNEPCDPEIAVITITIIGTIDINNDTIEVCNNGQGTIISFNDAIGIDDSNVDWWTDVDTSGVNMGNPNLVNFNGVDSDTFHFRYLVPEVGVCPEDSAFITVIVNKAPFAGDDGAGSICVGSKDTFNLFDYLGQDYTPKGKWIQIGGDPVDISKPDTVLFDSEPIGLDTFLYITEGLCGKDSAYVYMSVTSSPEAGDDYNYSVCQDEIVNLYDSLKNYNIGGTWFDSNLDTVFNFNSLILNDLKDYEFYYILSENGTCLGDTAFATITTLKAPDAGIGQVINICQNSSVKYDLFDYLTGNSADDGVWKNQINNVILTPNNYDFSSFPIGESTIKYILPDNGICPGDTAEIKVIVSKQSEAGNSNSTTVCNSDLNNIVDIEALLGNHDSGGEWTNVDGVNVNTINWKNVSFDGIAEGIYRFEYETTGNGICPSDKAIITVNVTKKKSAGNDKELTFCEGANIMVNVISELGPDGNTQYIVEDIDQTGALNPTSASVDISKLGINNKYKFSLVTGEGELCGTDTSYLLINIVGALNAGSDNSITVCNDETLVDLDALLGVHDLGGGWIDISGAGVDVTSSNGKSVSFSGVSKGEYVFEYKIESSSCPEASANITVIVNTSSESNVTETLCPGQIVTIGNSEYSTDNPTGIETMTNSVGCDSIINVQILEKHISSNVYFEDENCFGKGKFILETMNNSTLPVTVKIKGFGDFEVNSFPYEISDIPAGNYEFDIVDRDGCSSDVNESFSIEEFIPYTISTSVSTTETEHSIKVTTDINPETIVWSPTTSLSCSNCLNPIATPNVDIEYTVTITDADGCEVSDKIFLKAIIDDDVEIYIPNVFTPDGDGTNETFFVSSDIENAKYSMHIFDRWGELLYFADDLKFNDSTKGWDGLFKGKKLNTAVFVYMITIKYDNSEKKDVRSGDLLLVH